MSESKYGTVRSNKSRMLTMSPHSLEEKPSSADEVSLCLCAIYYFAIETT